VTTQKQASNAASAAPPLSNRLRQTQLDCVGRPIADLLADAKNPRTHSARQIKQIAKSIETFGFNVPVLIDAKSQIVAGHARVLAAKKLGWAEVPTIRLEHLTPEEAKAFQIADNRLSEMSSWDDVVLGETLRDLSVLDLNFDIEAIGFTMGEIDLRIEALGLTESEEADPVDNIPQKEGGPTRTRAGDLWKLGHHRVLCGNTLEPDTYSKLMGGKRASMVFTDPPYNVPVEGHVSGLGRIRHREFAMTVGEMSSAEFTAFLGRAIGSAAATCKDGSILYICMDWRHLTEVLAAGANLSLELKNLCVWAKDNAGMGSLYRSQHELVLVFKHGRGSHQNNVELGRNGRHRSNVWKYAGVNSFGRETEEGNLLALHPTVKPVKLVADAILDCSKRGDIVLDPFLGSGSTLMAAERVGRRCYGVELDPAYVDTIVHRWQAMTGDGAIHAETGERFHERIVEIDRNAKPGTNHHVA
jgi:DNA modification methylase